ncbi:MFS transporter [Dactylosporangium aurantiacum]|uniref:MFS transporter n=1 Tax=Dactylosporangium aurantiacum TaxID=35754 RepID=A0A9Q9INR2_9ACTN|nr:MDR family MFS transporter [Dactylosporangium aurantiacum]MDG6103938.1 MDR family MFS transporter [Dactylosporangium aurantiacum]UWZ58876.1 MFS transporter [Dactylosporangium aurantiacum]
MSSSMPGAEVSAGRSGPADPRRVRLVFAALTLTILLASLDQTILSTALPTVVGDLGSVDRMSWVVTAYVLAATIVMPLYGRFGDVLGRKPLFLAAICLFVAGSVIGGAAGSVQALIAGRFVQGLGGGGLIIVAQAIVADLVPARDRGRYTGVLGGVFAISSVAGPLLGGYFTDVAGWRWCFWINVPVGLVALLVAAVVLRLPAVPGRRPRLDAAGIMSSAAAVSCVVLVGVWGGTRYAWASPQILGLAAAAVVAGAWFVVAERRAAEPVIPMWLLRDRTFAVSTAVGLLVSVGMFAGVGYLPTFLQMVRHRDATSAGLSMIPLMAAILVTSVLSGQFISATGRYRALPVAGALVCVAGCLLLSRLGPTSSSPLIGGSLIVLGVGLGLILQVLVLVVQNAVPHDAVGTATAAHNFFREIGATLGTAVVGSAFTARLTESLTHGSSAAAGIRADSLTPALVAGLPDPVRSAVADAYAHALTPVLGWLAAVFVLAAALSLLLPHRPLSTTLPMPGALADKAPGQAPRP